MDPEVEGGAEESEEGVGESPEEPVEEPALAPVDETSEGDAAGELPVQPESPSKGGDGVEGKQTREGDKEGRVKHAAPEAASVPMSEERGEAAEPELQLESPEGDLSIGERPRSIPRAEAPPRPPAEAPRLGSREEASASEVPGEATTSVPSEGRREVPTPEPLEAQEGVAEPSAPEEPEEAADEPGIVERSGDAVRSLGRSVGDAVLDAGNALYSEERRLAGLVEGAVEGAVDRAEATIDRAGEDLARLAEGALDGVEATADRVGEDLARLRESFRDAQPRIRKERSETQ